MEVAKSPGDEVVGQGRVGEVKWSSIVGWCRGRCKSLVDGCGCVAEAPLTRLETKVKVAPRLRLPLRQAIHSNNQNYQFHRVSVLGKSFR